jgi:hypothetical protein
MRQPTVGDPRPYRVDGQTEFVGCLGHGPWTFSGGSRNAFAGCGVARTGLHRLQSLLPSIDS